MYFKVSVLIDGGAVHAGGIKRENNIGLWVDTDNPSIGLHIL